MITRYILFIPLIFLAGCSDYKELSFNCTGYLKEQTIVTGRIIAESNPKVVGIYITESTKTPFNFWRDKTHTTSVDNMVFGNKESTINDFAIMGRIEVEEDNFGDKVIQQFLLDRKTNVLTTNKTRRRPNYEKTERFEGACNPVKQ